MIRFLIKGVLRDRSRSLFPILTVAAGAFLVVFMVGWIAGARNDIVWSNAAFSTGHVKVMTHAYARESDFLPNELAIEGLDSLLSKLHSEFPDMIWSPRIMFGGLLDIPDQNGETRAQTTVSGTAVDFDDGEDARIMEIDKAIVTGRLPSEPDEIIISDFLAKQLDVSIGDTATLVGATMYGSMAMYNFTVCGTVRFGITAMDRSTVIADLAGVQQALDMQNAAGEVLGYFPDILYYDTRAHQMAAEFNAQYSDAEDFDPHMITLADQNGLGSMLRIVDSFGGILSLVFIIAMSIVLWNAGLMGSLRRYGEIGLRLAVGESKGHVYRSLIAESVMIGIGGAFIGTLLGLAATYYLQVKGIDISSVTRNSSMMISNVLRARITTASFYIGLIPGIAAPLLGTSISGIGIYKRQTAQLFKELEV